MDIEKDKDFKWPRPIKSDPEKRNQNLYAGIIKKSDTTSTIVFKLRTRLSTLLDKVNSIIIRRMETMTTGTTRTTGTYEIITIRGLNHGVLLYISSQEAQ